MIKPYEVPSHKLLVRAGFVRRVAPRIYSWLPLGMAVLGTVRRGEEMNAIGRRVPSGAGPREIYERRWALVRPATCCSACTTARTPTCSRVPRNCSTLLVRGRVLVGIKDYPRAVPGPDQVPRRGPRAPASCARADIAEGLVLLRPDRDEGWRSTVRTATPARRSSARLRMTYKIVFAVSGAMGGFRRRSSSPAASGEGYLRAVHPNCISRRTRRSRSPRRGRGPVRTSAKRYWTPRTPTSRRWRTSSASRRRRR